MRVYVHSPTHPNPIKHRLIPEMLRVIVSSAEKIVVRCKKTRENTKSDHQTHYSVFSHRVQLIQSHHKGIYKGHLKHHGLSPTLIYLRFGYIDKKENQFYVY